LSSGTPWCFTCSPNLYLYRPELTPILYTRITSLTKFLLVYYSVLVLVKKT
jgi:hypothetical protein